MNLNNKECDNLIIKLIFATSLLSYIAFTKEFTNAQPVCIEILQNLVSDKTKIESLDDIQLEEFLHKLEVAEQGALLFTNPDVEISRLNSEIAALREKSKSIFSIFSKKKINTEIEDKLARVRKYEDIKVQDLIIIERNKLRANTRKEFMTEERRRALALQREIEYTPPVGSLSSDNTKNRLFVSGNHDRTFFDDQLDLIKREAKKDPRFPVQGSIQEQSAFYELFYKEAIVNGGHGLEKLKADYDNAFEALIDARKNQIRVGEAMSEYAFAYGRYIETAETLLNPNYLNDRERLINTSITARWQELARQGYVSPRNLNRPITSGSGAVPSNYVALRVVKYNEGTGEYITIQEIFDGNLWVETEVITSNLNTGERKMKVIKSNNESAKKSQESLDRYSEHISGHKNRLKSCSECHASNLNEKAKVGDIVQRFDIDEIRKRLKK